MAEWYDIDYYTSLDHDDRCKLDEWLKEAGADSAKVRSFCVIGLTLHTIEYVVDISGHLSYNKKLKDVETIEMIYDLRSPFPLK